MSGGGRLDAREIDCLVSRHLVGVGRLRVVARDELPDHIREIPFWFLIMKSDPKDQSGAHIGMLSILL